MGLGPVNPTQLLTPRQVALAIGVSEASLKRWCDRGVLASIRTAGGHRRLSIPTVIEFLRRTGRPLVRPELLSLPSTTGGGAGIRDRAAEVLLEALLAVDEQRAERVIFDLFLARQSVADICDQTIAPAMWRIGELWEAGSLDIYEERRASEICMRALFRLSSLLPVVPESGPRAVGCSWEGDAHVLPSLMAELTLREMGWRALSLGPNIPLESMLRLLLSTRPALLWVSVCWAGDAAAIAGGFERLLSVGRETRTVIAYGGRAAARARNGIDSVARYCSQMSDLALVASKLTPPESIGDGRTMSPPDT